MAEAMAGTLQTYHSSWYYMAVMNSWYEGQWDTKALPIQLSGRHIYFSVGGNTVASDLHFSKHSRLAFLC